MQIFLEWGTGDRTQGCLTTKPHPQPYFVFYLEAGSHCVAQHFAFTETHFELAIHLSQPAKLLGLQVIKTTNINQYTHIRMVTIKLVVTPNAGEDM